MTTRVYTRRRRAAQRLAEMSRLADLRPDQQIDPKQWLFVAASCLALQQQGLDFYTLNDWLARFPVDISMDEESTMRMIHKVCGYYERGGRFMTNKAAGKLLEVTAGEREAGKLCTFDAVDEARGKRVKRKARERREGNRLSHGRRRADEGAVPRAEYLAKSLSQTKPWAAIGMSRAGWYRAGKPTPETSPSPYVSCFASMSEDALVSPLAARPASGLPRRR
jgi:hypothetical protein